MQPHQTRSDHLNLPQIYLKTKPRRGKYQRGRNLGKKIWNRTQIKYLCLQYHFKQTRACVYCIDSTLLRLGWVVNLPPFCVRNTLKLLARSRSSRCGSMHVSLFRPMQMETPTVLGWRIFWVCSESCCRTKKNENGIQQQSKHRNKIHSLLFLLQNV